MANLFPAPKYKAFDNNGDPLNGGKVNTYEPGTVTRKTTYTTAAGTIANTNPVILNARGEADIWWVGAYKVVVTDADDNVMYSVDNYDNSGFVTYATKAAVKAIDFDSSSAGQKIFITSADGGEFTVRYNATPGTYADDGGSYCGTQFIPTGGDGTIGIVRDYDGQISVRGFGAYGLNVDYTTEIQAAIDATPVGGVTFFPAGTYKIGTVLTVADADKITLLGEGSNSRIVKAANITMVSLGAESYMEKLYLDGDGVTYTGIGVSISTGANNNTSWRRLDQCDIMNTDSYGVEFTAAIAGFKTTLITCRIIPTLLATTAIKMPASETNGNRKIIGCDSASNTLVDLAGSQNTHLIGNDGAIPIYSSSTAKCIATGNRFSGTGTFTYDGTANVFTSNVIAAEDWVFSSTLFGSVFKNITHAAITSITDNAGGTTNGNEIEYPWQAYTPAWTATGTAPSLGNGTFNAAYHRIGLDMHVNIQFTAGGTTTFGTGAWSFSLPKAADRLAVGSARLTDTGTAFYSAVCEVISSASTVQVWGYNVGNSVTNTIPFTWASGDKISLDIIYPID